MLERTSRIILSSLSWQKCGLDKMAQHHVQLDLKSAQCWGIYNFPMEIMPMADCSHCEQNYFQSKVL